MWTEVDRKMMKQLYATKQNMFYAICLQNKYEAKGPEHQNYVFSHLNERVFR